MAIQKPNLDKFKKSSASPKKTAEQASKSDQSGDMFMTMGKAFLPMMPKKFQYVIGAALFFLAWGLVSFNYCMIKWMEWGYFFAIVLTIMILQLNDEFKIGKKLLSLIKKSNG